MPHAISRSRTEGVVRSSTRPFLDVVSSQRHADSVTHRILFPREPNPEFTSSPQRKRKRRERDREEKDIHQPRLRESSFTFSQWSRPRLIKTCGIYTTCSRIIIERDSHDYKKKKVPSEIEGIIKLLMIYYYKRPFFPNTLYSRRYPYCRSNRLIRQYSVMNAN